MSKKGPSKVHNNKFEITSIKIIEVLSTSGITAKKNGDYHMWMKK